MRKPLLALFLALSLTLSAPPAASQLITILTTHIQRLRAREAVQA